MKLLQHAVLLCCGFVEILGLHCVNTISASEFNNLPATSIEKFVLADGEKMRLKSLAAKGDGKAAYKLAEYFAYVESNEPEYMRWCQMAAKEGYVIAQYNLAVALQYRPRYKDDVQSLRWYMAAAENGYGDAQRLVAEAFRDGRGTKVDLLNARKWFEEAALSGDTEAMLELADCYEKGVVGKDLVMACAWIETAVKMIHPDSIRGREVAVKKKTIISHLSNEDIVRTRRAVDVIDKRMRSQENRRLKP